MPIRVLKRNGSYQEFSRQKIANAIRKAFEACEYDIEEDSLNEIANDVKVWDEITVEEIQDQVEETLLDYDYRDVHKSYVIYRYQRQLLRAANTTDKTILELIQGENEYWNKENANKRANKTSTQRDYIAGITSTDVANRLIFPKDIMQCHNDGKIHIHDMDYTIHPGITNCCLINLRDMLENGTVINDVLIEPPHRFTTACTIATQIIQNVASNQYGGLTISISHLAPFLRKSKLYWASIFPDYPDVCAKLYEKELSAGVQTLNYQINSFTASTGQSPFATVHIDLEERPEYAEEVKQIAEELMKQRLLGFKNKLGVYVTQTFPKIIVVLRDKYFTDPVYKEFIHLCALCTAKRMVPDYMSEKNMLKYKGAIVPAMGCRSLLKPIWNEGELKLWGRFNLGVCTVNLPYVAYEADGDRDKFWSILKERVEMCRRAQLIRVKRIANSTSDIAPTIWQYGAFARLPEGTKLSEIIYGGYASISLGYAGLYECTKLMTGESQSGEEGFKFAEQVMQFLDATTKEWSIIDNLGWGVYGTPLESTTYKFAKALYKFGYDRHYITNSIHIPVFEEIDPFEKLKIEGKLQVYSTGGNVNYIESTKLDNNLDAVIEVMKAINDYSLYAEINSKNDFCMACGSTEEQQINDDLEWFCPVCGCKDPTKLYHPRRICGYIQVGDTNKGRTQDIKERYVHLDNHEV